MCTRPIDVPRPLVIGNTLSDEIPDTAGLRWYTFTVLSRFYFVGNVSFTSILLRVWNVKGRSFT